MCTLAGFKKCTNSESTNFLTPSCSPFPSSTLARPVLQTRVASRQLLHHRAYPSKTRCKRISRYTDTRFVFTATSSSRRLYRNLLPLGSTCSLVSQTKPPYADHAFICFLQLLTALAQSAESLRNAAAMVDSFANLVQLTPQVGVPVSSMNPMAMYQMFANLQQQAGAVGAPFGAGVPVNTNGVVPGMSGGDMKVEEGGKRKRRRGEKKEKKPRDPNRPKRPPSAYLLFQNEVRKEMQERFPSMPYHELLSKISERWSHMSDTEKKACSIIASIFLSLTLLRFTTIKRPYPKSSSRKTRLSMTRRSPLGLVMAS